MSADDTASLKTTPLAALHAAHGARMVPFAGYSMPVQYPAGILAEHRHTRAHASIFDVSHMLQFRMAGAGVAAFLESCTAANIAGLAPGRYCYTQFLNPRGGIIDDLMLAKIPGQDDAIQIVSNAARADAVLDYLTQRPAHIALEVLGDRGMIALQGPAAVHAFPEGRDMAFLEWAEMTLDGAPALVSRSGYTGEDGFEISLPADTLPGYVERLLDREGVELAGLGARDSLRIEAGLCLYGQDITEDTTPVEAALTWSMSKKRCAAGTVPGAAILQQQLDAGPEKIRVGIRLSGRAPVRTGDTILPHGQSDGTGIGQISSGCFSPSLEVPVAMGYIAPQYAQPGTPITVAKRGRGIDGDIIKLPHVAHKYFRKPS